MYYRKLALVLAAAGTDCKVTLFTQKAKEVALSLTIQFVYALKLSGHTEWIRYLSFASDENCLLLASAAQDKYVRLWRISTADKLSEK